MPLSTYIYISHLHMYIVHLHMYIAHLHMYNKQVYYRAARNCEAPGTVCLVGGDPGTSEYM